MPDVLGISQDALCPDASCELAHNETGTAEPCEHQLDLLVDVIDFLSSDHTEVSVSADESYNEAAQTLLTIGNLAHLTQSAQNQIDMQDDVTGTTSVSANETSQPLEKENASKPAVQEEIDSTPLQCAASDRGVTETVPTVEPRSSTTDNDDVSVIERIDSDVDPTLLLQSPESSKTSSPQTRRGRVSRVKPKPNLGQASRTAQVKPETSKVRTSEESHSVPQTTDTPLAAEETSETVDCSKRLLKDDMACIKVKHTVETSGSQERSVGPLEPSREPATMDSRFTSPSTEEAPMSQIETAESISSNLLTLDAAVTESQIGLESNVVSAPVPESSNHPAPCVAPVEELPVGKMEENQVASTQQTRKSRFQKVKPKVNLAQASRAVRSKPQTTKDAIEKDPTPDPTFNEKPAVEAKAESTYSTAPEKPSQGHDPASVLIPSLDLGMTLTPTEELSTTEQKNPDVGVVVQVDSDSAASHQSASESLSEAQFEPSKEQTSRDTTPTSDSTDEKLTSHVGHTEGITESEVGLGSDSVPVQEVEESPVRQEEEVKPAFRTTRGRLQKVKPNLPQTSRGARSKPQTTIDAVEKDPTPDPKFNEKPTVEAKAESTCSASPEKPSQSHDPASVLLPSLDLGMTLTPTEELSTTKQKNPDVGVVVQVESDAAASHQSASESQNLSETQFEPSKEQTSRDAMLKSESTDEKRMSYVGHTERMTESEVGHGSDSVPVPVQDVEESPVSREEEVKSAFWTTRGRLQKAKPNLPQTSRGARSKPQTTKDPIAPTQPAETPSGQTSRPESTDDTLAKVEVQPTCSTNPETLSQTASVSLELHSTHKTTEELSSTEEQKAQVGRRLDSTSEGSQQNVPRRRFPKVKPRPNLGSSPRTARAKLQPDDGGKAPEPQPVDNNGAQTEQEPVESGESLDGRNNKGTSSDGVVIATPRVAESRSASTDSVVENKSDEKLTVESTREETSTNESQDAVQLRPETSQTAAQSTVDKKSEATESPSRKGPQAGRGRLIKPKPRLGRSTIRPPQPKQIQNTKQAEADFGTCSERVSEHPAGIQQPVEGAIEQVPDSCTRDASTSRTGTQHSPDLTLFPDLSVLSQSSDPDEPFFILSLTEIPVCPSGEVEEPPLPYLPLTDASTQQWSVPGDVTVPVSMETPVDPNESTTVHPAELPETGENTDETGIPTTNQRRVGTRRRAKLEPDTIKGEQASESVGAKEAASAQRSELAGPSVLPDAVDDAVNEPQGGSGDHVGGGERPENSGSEAQTSWARGACSWNRNTIDPLSLSPETTTTALTGDSGRGRGSRGRKVRTRGGKLSTPMRSATPPTLSTPSITSPTPTELQDVTRTSEGGPSPDASSCPAEVSVAMETSSIEEEPTNVSQYFLSDIFTDVDET